MPAETTDESRANRAGRARRLVSFFRLTKNFCLAYDHRIESGSDPEQMLNALFSFVTVKRQRCTVAVVTYLTVLQ